MILRKFTHNIVGDCSIDLVDFSAKFKMLVLRDLDENEQAVPGIEPGFWEHVIRIPSDNRYTTRPYSALCGLQDFGFPQLGWEPRRASCYMWGQCGENGFESGLETWRDHQRRSGVLGSLIER